MSPGKLRNESASETIVTLSVPAGWRRTRPFAVSEPFAVVLPVIVKALFTVVVPDAAPNEREVAAPPTFNVVTPELRRLNVLVPDVNSPPLIAKSPPITPLLFIVVVPEPAPIAILVAAPPKLSDVALVLKRFTDEAVVVMSPPLTAILPPKVASPVLLNENVGLVVMLPKLMSCAPVVVLMEIYSFVPWRIEKASAMLFTMLLVIVPVPLAVSDMSVPLMFTKSPPSPRLEMPFDENVPVTTRSLLTVVVPDDEAIETSVASPPILSVLTPELKTLAVVWFVVIEPPLTAMFPLLSTTNESAPAVCNWRRLGVATPASLMKRSACVPVATCAIRGWINAIVPLFAGRMICSFCVASSPTSSIVFPSTVVPWKKRELPASVPENAAPVNTFPTLEISPATKFAFFHSSNPPLWYVKT